MNTESKPIIITKAGGDKVPFDEDKLRNSLNRSGASPEIIQQVISEVEGILYHGIPTKKIYKKAFQLLRKYSKPVAAKYKLKQALMELGPSGYPFEIFAAELLRFQGYSVKTDQIIKGHCVDHEVDLIARKGKELLYGECKFHNSRDRYCDVKVPMYIQSRFYDLERERLKGTGKDELEITKWIFNNTRFTADAIQYANCMGLKLVSWDYPHKGSLRERVDVSGLHPVTCLSSITKKEKAALIDRGVVLCKTIINDPDLMERAGIKKQNIKKALKEAQGLCGHQE